MKLNDYNTAIKAGMNAYYLEILVELARTTNPTKTLEEIKEILEASRNKLLELVNKHNRHFT